MNDKKRSDILFDNLYKKDSNRSNKNNSNIFSKSIIFLFLFVFIYYSSYFSALFSSYFNNDSLVSHNQSKIVPYNSLPDDYIVQNNIVHHQDIKQSTKVPNTSIDLKIDLSKIVFYDSDTLLLNDKYYINIDNSSFSYSDISGVDNLILNCSSLVSDIYQNCKLSK